MVIHTPPNKFGGYSQKHSLCEILSKRQLEALRFHGACIQIGPLQGDLRVRPAVAG